MAGEQAPRLPELELASGDLQVVARVARLLRLFTPSQPAIRLAEGAAELGVGRTTAHRYLASLENHGFLKRVHGSSYELGPLLVQLGVLASIGSRVIEAAGPVMRELMTQVQQTAVLSVWGAAGPVVARVEEDRTRVISVSVAVGSTLPLDSAQGLVFLSRMEDPRVQQGLVRGLVPQLAGEIDAELPGAKGAKAVVRETPESGVRAIAAPVFDRDQLCATLAVVGITTIMPKAASSEMAKAVAAAGARLSELVSGVAEEGQAS